MNGPGAPELVGYFDVFSAAFERACVAAELFIFYRNPSTDPRTGGCYWGLQRNVAAVPGTEPPHREAVIFWSEETMQDVAAALAQFDVGPLTHCLAEAIAAFDSDEMPVGR